MDSLGGTQRLGSSQQLSMAGSQKLGTSQKLGGSRSLEGTGALNSTTGLGSTAQFDVKASGRAFERSEGLEKQLARLKDATDTYPKHAAKSRGVRCHSGPPKLRDSMPPRDCLKWCRENKAFHPYTYFESANNVPKPMHKKSKGPPQLWLPVTHSEQKDEDKKTAKAELEQAALQVEKDAAEASSPKSSPPMHLAAKTGGDTICRLPGNTIADRAPWIGEHNVMFSRMNHEVQTFCREYFDNPKRTDADGVPKVRERYCMNDRQMGWNDEPSLLGEPKRTYLDNVAEYNVGGPKCQQLPSYWRRINDWRAFSEPALQNVPVPAISRFKNRNMLEALANTPADASVKFWRTWSKTSVNRLPKKDDLDEKPKKGQKAKAKPKPVSPAVELKPRFVPRVRPSGEGGWDNRWSVMKSKDNDQLPVQERMFFRKVEYLNGSSLGYAAVEEKNRVKDPYLQAPYVVD